MEGIIFLEKSGDEACVSVEALLAFLACLQFHRGMYSHAVYTWFPTSKVYLEDENS